MDEAAVAEIGEDGADRKARSGDGASGNNAGPSAEETFDRVGVYCCQDCGEAFREEATYLQHRHQHLQENVYFDDQMDGLRAAEKDRGTGHFCTLCSLSFVELNEFHLHMERIHSQTSQKASGIGMNSGITKHHIHKCTECGKCYGVIGHFLNHQRSHRQASKSVFHDLEHLKKKSFQCESCGRNYSRASALDAHRRCHEEKLVKPRNRSSGDSLHTEEPVTEIKPSENQTEDTPENLFKCSCGKAFSALLRLRTHQRFSRNAQCSPEEMKKPKKNGNDFYCSECKKGFSGHIALYNHQRWHANHSNDSVKKFPCEECGKVFMTLTFYYRHQRMAHSDETPAKSFLHQVCQLQKKAFECKECGLKFSRASALHSHQLHHTDVFRETEKETQVGTSVLPQENKMESSGKETEDLEEKVESECLLSAFTTEDDAHASDEDVESYEPGDFNVQVISASESEDEPVQDLNPDLELLCESDQEVHDEADTEVSPNIFVSKPEMDLKIVQVDFEQADEQCALIPREAETKPTGERFDCPECYRWFTSASSLRVHRMWHGVHRRREQAQGQSVAHTCGHEASSCAAQSSHKQSHKDQITSEQAEGLEKKTMTCSECGKGFSCLSALVSHQLHHPKRKQFQCPGCMMSYMHATSLFNHMKNCSAQKRENNLITKKEYNPKKTLLGPKSYHCEQCGKGFWSLGAYSHHKQNQTECADLRLRKGVAGPWHSVNGHPRSTVKVACPVCGRKFRHRGIMALHMRKHENGNHKCELCNRSFRIFSSLLRHQVVHNEQLLPPPIKSFQHQVEQLKKNTYSCPDCAKLFSRAKALQFHMKSHGYETGLLSSPQATISQEDLQCAKCHGHFNNKASLRSHQIHCSKRDSQAFRRKTHDTLLSSQMEGSTVGSSDQIALGTRNPQFRNVLHSVELEKKGETGVKGVESTSTTDLKYKCKKCDRSFSVVGALNFHKRIHAEGYKSMAKVNEAMSVRLKSPKQEESVKGPFHCSECGRRFMSNSALGSHKRWHKEKKCSRPSPKDDSNSCNLKTEDGPFQCNRCGKQFFNHCVLQRHQVINPHCQTKGEPETDSNKNAESSSVLEKFLYPECSKTFVQSSSLVAPYEKEHVNSFESADHQGEGLVAVNQVTEKDDIMVSETESVSLTLKPKGHQCPLCSMTFAKARGLRAHKWQAHSKGVKGRNRVPKKLCITSSSVGKKTEDSSDVDNTVVMESFPVENNNSPAGRRRKKIKPDLTPVKSVSCLDCGKLCDSACALLDHRKVCLEIKRESKHEAQNLEGIADVSPPLNRLSEHTVKCLFKCDKCGKAFQTEEQLENHKTKAKSRPYCCALCCHGFWTENQLQQHLAWHDEVRCRLPTEVRYRLNAAMTSKPLKPSFPTVDHKGKHFSSPTQDRPTLYPESQSQSSHKCHRCGKAFLSPVALQKHETQQCNSNSYHCSVCPRTFSDIQDLIDHHQECISVDKSQNDMPSAVTPGTINGLTCLECGTTFCQETDLHQHYIEHARGVY